MHEVHDLFSSPSIYVGDAHCRAGRSGFGPVEEAASYTVILPRAGVFVGRLRGEPVPCDANSAVFLDRGESYRVSHPLEGGDRCTVICFGERTLRDIAADHVPGTEHAGSVGFGLSLAPTTRWVDGLHRQLVARLARADGNGAEEDALAIVGRAFATGLALNGKPARGRQVAARRRRELTEAARELLATRFADKVSLDELAGELECSPYHLSRVFRAHTGITVHRYQDRLRIRAAQERISLGERELSRLASELGFADHGHLSRVFRRETGRTPSSFRRDCSNEVERRPACGPPPHGAPDRPRS